MARQEHNSIEKALHILMAFTPGNDPMGTVELSRMLGFHKATTSRILLTLVAKGLLRQDSETRKFSLGPAAIDIGRAVLDSVSGDIASIARPQIDQLRDELEETVILEQFMVESTVITHMAEGSARVRLAGGVGDRLPINVTAGAKAILAFLESDVAGELIRSQKKFEAFTDKTITDPEALIRQLPGIRKRGYAIDREENECGISGIGFPVFNHEDLPVAAVVVVGLTVKIDQDMEKIVRMLGRTARSISLSLMQK